MTLPDNGEVLACAACGEQIDATSEACFFCGHVRRSPPLLKGQVVGDRYELKGVLGRGGMGTVYEAHDRSLDERVALKVLSEAVRGSKDADRRFRDEIKLARKIRHPNVCGIHEYGKVEDIQYIVMEYIDGQDLKKYVRSRGKLSTEEAIEIARQIGAGLQAIHDAGVIHRDLKLANVMRDATGRLILMDFGIAKGMGDTTATATGHIIGTPEYMSPEQVQGLGVDPRSDLYSLGAITYELLTGRVPFKADTPLATIMLQVHEPPNLDDPTIPATLVPILRKALAKNPVDRYETVKAFITALTTANVSTRPVARDPQPAPPTPAPAPPPPAPPAPPVTIDIARPKPAPPVKKQEWRPPQANQPPPRKSSQSSELRFFLWVGTSLSVVGVAAATWYTMQNQAPRNRPEVKPSPIVLQQTPTPEPVALVSTPEPTPVLVAPTPEPERAQTPRPVFRPTPPPPTPAPTPIATPFRPAATPTPRTFLGLAVTPAPIPAPTPARPARTPLPFAGLTALPTPTPFPAPTPTPRTAFLGLAVTPAPASTPDPRSLASVGMGILQLGAKPYAKVIIDGKEVGTLPMRPIEIVEGRHVVRFLHPDYQPLQRAITIQKGETVKLFVDFTLDGIAK